MNIFVVVLLISVKISDIAGIPSGDASVKGPISGDSAGGLGSIADGRCQ